MLLEEELKINSTHCPGKVQITGSWLVCTNTGYMVSVNKRVKTFRYQCILFYLA